MGRAGQVGQDWVGYVRVWMVRVGLRWGPTVGQSWVGLARVGLGRARWRLARLVRTGLGRAGLDRVGIGFHVSHLRNNDKRID